MLIGLITIIVVQAGLIVAFLAILIKGLKG